MSNYSKLLLLFACLGSAPWLQAQELAEVYLLQNGAVKTISHEYMRGEYADLQSVIILGYVEKPGIYLFKDPQPLSELLINAGTVTFPNGERSSRTVRVRIGDTKFEIDADYSVKNPDITIKGGEVFYRNGLMGVTPRQ